MIPNTKCFWSDLHSRKHEHTDSNICAPGWTADRSAENTRPSMFPLFPSNLHSGQGTLLCTHDLYQDTLIKADGDSAPFPCYSAELLMLRAWLFAATSPTWAHAEESIMPGSSCSWLGSCRKSLLPARGAEQPTQLETMVQRAGQLWDLPKLQLTREDWDTGREEIWMDHVGSQIIFTYFDQRAAELAFSNNLLSQLARCKNIFHYSEHNCGSSSDWENKL